MSLQLGGFTQPLPLPLRGASGATRTMTSRFSIGTDPSQPSYLTLHDFSVELLRLGGVLLYFCRLNCLYRFIEV